MPAVNNSTAVVSFKNHRLLGNKSLSDVVNHHYVSLA